MFVFRCFEARPSVPLNLQEALRHQLQQPWEGRSDHIRGASGSLLFHQVLSMPTVPPERKELRETELSNGLGYLEHGCIAGGRTETHLPEPRILCQSDESNNWDVSSSDFELLPAYFWKGHTGKDTNPEHWHPGAHWKDVSLWQSSANGRSW